MLLLSILFTQQLGKFEIPPCGWFKIKLKYKLLFSLSQITESFQPVEDLNGFEQIVLALGKW